MPLQNYTALLTAAGYRVENMSLEHGDRLTGQYRWVNQNGWYQSQEPFLNPIFAWAYAWEHFINAKLS